jgi:site-specific recombinase XerD
MGLLQDSMIRKMTASGYSVKTIRSYTSCVRALAVYYAKSPLDVTKQEIEDFIYFLRSQKKSESTVHIYYEAIKYFFRSFELFERIPRISFPRINKKLPAILSQQETIELLCNCRSLKFKTLFSLIYSAGLRISEATNLRLEDIDFVRKTIFIRNGKNKKDRYTLLANETIYLLRSYFAVYHPQCYVFYSTDVMRPISTSCAQRHFRKLLQDNHINSSIHVHTLRHCFATHLLENGTSIFHIMHLLGHSNIQTTMIYLHMQSIESLNIKSPIDLCHLNYQPGRSSSPQDLFEETA